MAGQDKVIPWAAEEVWRQVVVSVSKTIAAMGQEAAGIRAEAKKICRGYAELDTILDTVCGESCPSCFDVCCKRATVWYDLPDLLVIYLNTGALPQRQIYRRPDLSCCNLTPAGCCLTRSGRPFICTWYVCPEQQEVVHRLAASSGKESTVFCLINDIKTARKDLEQAYINSICGCSSRVG